MKRKDYKKRRIPTKQKTTTRKGKNEYMKAYMRQWRKEQKIKLKTPSQTLGFKLKERKIR